MLFLSPRESARWELLGQEALKAGAGPRDLEGEVRSNLRAFFHFYAGAFLAAKGREERAMEWFVAGAEQEEEDLMLNAFTAAFMERQGGRFHMPDVAFADPAPYLHFTTVPYIRDARANLLRQSGESLPAFRGPFRIVDVGCGDGGLLVSFINHLRDVGKVADLGEILLIDFSPAMIDLAERTVGGAFPSARIGSITKRVEACAAELEGRYDVALMSLAYHHMPWESKVRHMMELKEKADHFVVFEMNANNDRPEIYSPELAVSVYQSYGRLVDAVFAHDAPVEVANACVDRFLMTEAVSVLTQPRGVRTDYHMLRHEWHELFKTTLGPEAFCGCDSTAYTHDAMELITIHYGK